MLSPSSFDRMSVGINILILSKGDTLTACFSSYLHTNTNNVLDTFNGYMRSATMKPFYIDRPHTFASFRPNRRPRWSSLRHIVVLPSSTRLLVVP